MKTIHKYPINYTGHFELNLPKDAKILCAQTQLNNPCLWVMIDLDHLESITLETRAFYVAGTGWVFDERLLKDYIYIETFQIIENSKSYVFHLFEIKDLKKL